VRSRALVRGAPRRAALGAAFALAAGLPLACSDDQGAAAGDLVWTKPPNVYRQATLPRDRVLVGTIRNDSLQPVKVAATEVRAVDAEGDALRGNATFVRGYIHAVYPPTRPPAGGLPESELERTGRQLRLEPGKTAPLSVAWRLTPGREAPVRIDYGSGSLPIP
jgi:hypothetical protein